MLFVATTELHIWVIDQMSMKDMSMNKTWQILCTYVGYVYTLLVYEEDPCMFHVWSFLQRIRSTTIIQP